MKIGILKAGSIPNELSENHIEYWEMWRNAVIEQDPSCKITIFDIRNDEFPSKIDECDSYICTGSASSAYSNEVWVFNLIKFVRECHKQKKKLLGICFGHQLIALALGGKCERSSTGWGIGIKRSYIKSEQRWLTPFTDKFDLIYSHQDQVTELPIIANHIGFSDHCRYSMFSVEDHILGIQGHPEWSIDYALDLLEFRSSIINKTCLNKALATLENSKPDSELVLGWAARFLMI